VNGDGMNRIIFILVAFLMMSCSLFCEWLEKTHLDDFGDPTDFRFIETAIIGTFSNDEIDNTVAYITYHCSCDSLSEFMISIVTRDNKVNFNNRTLYTLRVKDDNGIVTEYSNLASITGDKLFLIDIKLIKQIKKNNKLKMIITTDDRRLKINFVMDCNGFSRALKYFE
jgi:hypothetical protein